jgi:acetyl-CoA synthetase
MRTLWGDHKRFEEAYFSQYPGYYFTGDGCRRDADGYYWITGRVDDVINVSGHRMGTAEVESALVAHEGGRGRGRGLPARHQGAGHLCLCHADERGRAVRRAAQGAGGLGPHRDRPDRQARPDPVGPGLPKTRSGKIMRRILRKIAENDFGALGDTSTLADPSVVDDLIANRMNRA